MDEQTRERQTREETRFDGALKLLAGATGRRAALRTTVGGLTVAAVGSLVGSGSSRARKKGKKKCKKATCPECMCPPPPPPPVPFCTGKNSCAEAADIHCGTSGAVCNCFIRDDTGGPFCGVFSRNIASCADCAPAAEVCVRGGLECGVEVFCMTPCAIPK